MINTSPQPISSESRGSHVLMPRGNEGTDDGHPPRYACHRCAATSYRALMARGLDGAMRPSGRHACTGCRFEFGHVSEWIGERGSLSGSAGPVPLAGPSGPRLAGR